MVIKGGFGLAGWLPLPEAADLRSAGISRQPARRLMPSPLNVVK